MKTSRTAATSSRTKRTEDANRVKGPARAKRTASATRTAPSPVKSQPQRTATRYLALLRAVNVGGTGKLPMADLKSMCTALGFANVQTYIASGNVVFESDAPSVEIQRKLEVALEKYAGKPVGVFLRTAQELAEVLQRNPFPLAPPNRVIVCFCSRIVPLAELTLAAGRKEEQLSLGITPKPAREYFVYYPQGQAETKLKLPAATESTGRNINTVAKLLEMLLP